MLIEIWKPATPLPVTGYLYFRSEDEIAVKAAIAKLNKTAPIPLTVSVKPNGEKQLGLIHAHIIGLNRNDTGWIEKTDFGAYEYPTRRILELGAEIVSGLRDQSSERVGIAALALEYLISKIPSSSRTSTHNALFEAARYLAELAQQCLTLLEHGSPFIHTTEHDQNKSWWKGSPSLVLALRSKKNEIPIRFGAVTSNGVDALNIWLTKIHERLVRLSTQTAKIQLDDALLEASAYCAALAERYHLRNNSALALLLLHRSADLCLLRVCSQNKCIDWTFHGGQYDLRTVGGKDSRIALSRSVEVVDAMPLLLADPKRSAAFIELNRWRNLLIQTHCLSDIDEPVVRNIFRKVRPYLEFIGGADWKVARDSYLRGVQLGLSDLLNIDGSLTGTFEVVQLG